MNIKKKNNYYNDEDEINFEKLSNFSKFNSRVKNNNQSKNHNIKYANSDKNYFNNILKLEKNLYLLDKENERKKMNYYNSSDFQKFEFLNNFPEYEDVLNQKEKEKINYRSSYTLNDFDEFNKIIQVKNDKEKMTNDQINKVKVIDYKKLKENGKKLKNKMGIDKIKIVYFD